LSKPPFEPTRSVASSDQSVQDARELEKQGKSEAQLRHVEDEAIRNEVHMQEEIGLHGITDGESAAAWHNGLPLPVRRRKEGAGQLNVRFQNERGAIEFTPSALQITAN